MKSFKALFFICIGFALLLRACKSEGAEGRASWYGAAFAGKPMANGQPFDPQGFTCASWDYPLGTRLWVRNKANGKTVEVTVTDRGPAKRLHRILDLSEAAFSALADPKLGVITVEVIHAY